MNTDNPREAPAPRVFDAYVRVSKVAGRDRDAERFISPKLQRQRITGWQMSRGDDEVVVGEWHEDLDVSGATTADERPGLKRAFERIERGESHGIVVAQLDRFSRSVAGALRDLEWLRRHEAEFASVGDNIDTTTPNGEFLFTVVLAMAQLERAQRAEGWERARRDAVVERGWHLTSEGVTGYVFGSQPLEPHERWGPVVSKMFADLARRIDAGEIARTFNALGVPRGRRKTTAGWEAQHIRKMAARRVYLGEAHHGRDIVKVGAHPALTDDVTWVAAQRTGKSPVIRAHARGMRLQKATLICSQCCQPLRGGTVNNHGRREEVYRCRGTRNGHRCPGPQVSVTAALVDGFVDEQAQALLDQIGADRPAHVERFVEVEDLLDRALADREAAMRLEGIVDADAFVAEVRARQGRIDELRAELGALHAANPALRDLAHHVDQPALSETLLRSDIHQVIDCIVVRPSRRDSGARLTIDQRCIVVRRGLRPDFVADHYRPTERRPFPVAAWLAQHGTGHVAASALDASARDRVAGQSHPLAER